MLEYNTDSNWGGLVLGLPWFTVVYLVYLMFIKLDETHYKTMKIHDNTRCNT